MGHIVADRNSRMLQTRKSSLLLVDRYGLVFAKKNCSGRHLILYRLVLSCSDSIDLDLLSNLTGWK